MTEHKSEDPVAELGTVFLLGIFELFILIMIFPKCSFLGCCGDDYLYLLENTRAKFWSFLLIGIVQLIVALAFFRSRLLVIKHFLLIFGAVNILLSVNRWYNIPELEGYYEEFDIHRWHSEQPIPMARVFIKDERFIDKTRSEIIEIFGTDYYEYQYGYYQNRLGSGDAMAYPIYGAYSELLFILKDDKVILCTLECDDYG